MPCPPPVSRPRLPSPSFPDGQSSPGDVLPSVPRPAHAAPSAGAPSPTPVSPVGLCRLPISHGKLSLVSAPSAWSSHRDAAPLSSLDCEPAGQSPAPSRWPGRWPGVSRANEFQTRPVSLVLTLVSNIVLPGRAPPWPLIPASVSARTARLSGYAFEHFLFSKRFCSSSTCKSHGSAGGSPASTSAPLHPVCTWGTVLATPCFRRHPCTWRAKSPPSISSVMKLNTIACAKRQHRPAAHVSGLGRQRAGPRYRGPARTRYRRTVSPRRAPAPLAKPVLLQPGRARVFPVMTETCEQSGRPPRRRLRPGTEALVSLGENLPQVDTHLQLPRPRLPRVHTQPVTKRGVGSGPGALRDLNARPFPGGSPAWVLVPGPTRCPSDLTLE